jgi:alpha-L-rhamnosidase
LEKQWRAQWIKDPQFSRLNPTLLLGKELRKAFSYHHEAELQNHHILVRKVFKMDQKTIDNAYIDITADDYYKLYINGKYVAQGPAQSYHFHYYYNRLDIRDFLVHGENVIAVHVYYQGLVNRAFNSGDYRQGLIAEIHVNERLSVKTDNTWKYKLTREYKKGEPYGYLTQFPENIDSRRSSSGWRDLEFNDDDWMLVDTDHKMDYSLVLQPTPNLSVYEIAPVHIKKLNKGHYLIDYGQEITGQFKMCAKGESGEIVEIRCGEELDESGIAVRFELRCNCIYKETWTLSGEMDVLEFYDYKAFRYVEVIGSEDAIDKEQFSVVVRHYPFEDKNCEFNSSDELLNQVFQICKNGVKYGSQENYVDCPTREKGQYLGDNTIIGHTHMLLSGDLRLFKKAIKQFALSSIVCPGLMAVTPGNYMQEIADFSLQWPMQLLNYYQQSGDMDFLEEMYPYAENLVKHFKKYDRGDGLLHEVKDKWNLVDWPENLRDGYDFELSRPVGSGCHNVVNAFYYGCLQTVNEIRTILGIPMHDDNERFKASFVNVFYSAETKLFVDAEGSQHSSLHANMLPLLFGLSPDGAVDSTVSLIKEKRLSCGVYMSYFLLKALARVGEYELIFDLISSDDERSWGNMVKEGATTCFEAWGKDQKWNTSLCHPWASAPVPVLVEDIIGIKPHKAGWDEILFTPHIPKRLKDFAFHIHVRTGLIQVVCNNGEIKIKAPDRVRIITKNE